MTEVWRPVVGYEGLYEVSNEGRVKRLPRVVERVQYGRLTKQQLEEKFLTPVLSVPLPSNQGRYRVTLTKERAVRLCLVHVLVLEAFVGPRPGNAKDWHGCHNDGNPANNRLDNLRWDRRTANEADKLAHGTVASGEKNGHAKLDAEKVAEIRKRLAAGEGQRDLADEFGVSRSAILHINLGSTWTHVE